MTCHLNTKYAPGVNIEGGLPPPDHHRKLKTMNTEDAKKTMEKGRWTPKKGDKVVVLPPNGKDEGRYFREFGQVVSVDSGIKDSGVVPLYIVQTNLVKAEAFYAHEIRKERFWEFLLMRKGYFGKWRGFWWGPLVYGFFLFMFVKGFGPGFDPAWTGLGLSLFCALAMGLVTYSHYLNYTGKWK